MAPLGTPEPVITQRRAAVRQAVNDQQVKQIVESVRQPIQYLDQADFRLFLDQDAKKIADVVKQIGKVEEKK